MGGWVLLTSLISIILDFLVSCISKHKLNYISKWLPNQYNGGTVSFHWKNQTTSFMYFGYICIYKTTFCL